ncbi:MAG: ROK family protein [Betaproteobacteria bacterium]|nr:MAG: ROK family protein [Betaproteobacteria bacterium]
MLRLGIDLGGTKTEIIALDDVGRELLRKRVTTERGDYDVTLQTIVSLVDDTERELGDRGSVGIGTPGALSPATGLMRNCNSTWLNGQALRDDLIQRLDRDVLIENDANCFALSEATDGAGAGHRVVFGVILGTGVGGGVVVDGKLLTGPNRIAGEWGHNPLPWPRDEERPGPACYCGKNGCIETFLCGPALSRDHAQHNGMEISTHEIVSAAAQGEACSLASLERYEDRLARALANVINILDPDVIVLGGGMSNIPRWHQRVPELWTQWVFSDRVDTPLLRNRHGDSSGVRGAAWLGS